MQRPIPQLCTLSFFFNVTATTEIYTLSLHDALPISPRGMGAPLRPHARERHGDLPPSCWHLGAHGRVAVRSEEHTSELQSRLHLVCRLLLEKKKTSPTALRGTLP